MNSFISKRKSFVHSVVALLLCVFASNSLLAETVTDMPESVIDEIISNTKTVSSLIKDDENSPVVKTEITKDLILELAKQVSLLQSTLDMNADGELDASEVANSKRAILKLDLDSDGVISSAELGALEEMPELLRLSSVLQALDLDGDNKLSIQEVVEAEQNLKVLDINSDWRIDVAELTSSVSKDNFSSWYWLVEDFDSLKAHQAVSGAEYLLVHQADRGPGLVLGTHTLLLSANGDVQHQWRHTSPAAQGSRAELLANGLLLRSSAVNQRKPFSESGDMHGLIELIDWNGNVVWRYERCKTNNYCLYGPVLSLPNGNILVTSFENDATFISSKSDGGETITAGIYELKPDYVDGTTELIWSWGGNIIKQQAPDDLAGLSYNQELNQIVFTTRDHQQAIILERGSTDPGTALHSIAVEDLLGVNEDSAKLEIIDTQWLEDISGQADIALLIKASDRYSILELSLPLNKNGTYMEGVKPIKGKSLPLLNSANEKNELHGLKPLQNGGFMVLDKSTNQVLHITPAGEQAILPVSGRAQITSAQNYSYNYAAFNDKGLATSVAASELQQTEQVQNQQPDQAEDDPLTGIWSMMIDTPMGEEALELTLVQQGDLIAGDLDGDPLLVEVNENTIQMKLERTSPAGVVTIIYNGVIEDTDMRGEYNFNSGPTTGTSMTWTASR